MEKIKREEFKRHIKSRGYFEGQREEKVKWLVMTFSNELVIDLVYKMFISHACVINFIINDFFFYPRSIMGESEMGGKFSSRDRNFYLPLYYPV